MRSRSILPNSQPHNKRHDESVKDVGVSFLLISNERISICLIKRLRIKANTLQRYDSRMSYDEQRVRCSRGKTLFVGRETTWDEHR